MSSAPASPVASRPPTPTYAAEETVEQRVQAIQASLRQIVCSDQVDKPTALKVTQLFHDMETLFRDECARREQQILQLDMKAERQRLEVEMDRLARRYTLDQMQQPPEPRRRSR